MVREPRLRVGNGRIAVIPAALEDDIGGEPIVVPLQSEGAGHGLRRGRANMPGDQIEHEIMPGHRGSGGDELLAIARDHQHTLRAQGYVREHRGKRGLCRNL